MKAIRQMQWTPLSAELHPVTADDLEVSIVMPCLNEAETLDVCITKARNFLARHGIRGEVVVADNGSTDGSTEIAIRAGARVVPVREKGYGAAIAGGVRAARGTYVIVGDADDSYDFSDLMPFVERLREGYDLVMGNRFRGGIKEGAMPSLHRYLGNPVLTWIGRLFFKCPSGDFHCGLRGFRRDAFVRMDLRTTGMEFASEMIVKASMFDLRIAEVPTTLSPDGRSRAPHLRRWRDGWRHLRFLLLYSPRWLFLYPGLLLITLGVGVGAWLLPGPRVVGPVTLDVHTLLYAAMAVIVGFQVVAFAAFTKIFAFSQGLLPISPRAERLLQSITLETGLLIGLGLSMLGFAGSVYALGAWASNHFGALDPVQSLRLVAPAIVALTLGVQVVFTSFFLSVLRMPAK